MKKVIAICMLLTLMLGLCSVAALPGAAAEVSGDWTTYRAASEYPENSDKPQKPEAGYKYTDEGFTVVPADYTDSAPFMTVQSKELQPIKEGIYMEFRVDDYSYNGPEHNIDNWICISITNKEKVVPGAPAYGGGWMCLIRGNGEGAEAKTESCNTVEKTESNPGSFNNLGGKQITPKLDDQGREIYTLEGVWNGSQYTFKLNGVTMQGMSTISANLENLNPNGEFYVGVTLYSSVKDGTAAMTILKYGTDKDHAYTPQGTDSKEPEPNLLKVAEIADPSTVPAGQPALYWDAAVANTPNGTNINLTALGDNAFRVNLSETLGYFSWNISRDTSYNGADFPVFTALLRNFYGDGGTLWYYGGNIIGATDSNRHDWSINDGYYWDGGDDEYVLVTIDLTDLWEGRINGVRYDFAAPDPNAWEFDICYMGFFASEDAALAFCEKRLTEMGVTGEEVTEADTEVVTEVSTEASTEVITEASTEVITEAATAGGNETTAEVAATEEGCASVVTVSAVSTLCVLISAGVVLKKKEKEL